MSVSGTCDKCGIVVKAGASHFKFDFSGPLPKQVRCPGTIVYQSAMCITCHVDPKEPGLEFCELCVFIQEHGDPLYEPGY